MIKTTKFKNATIRFTDQGKGRAIVLLHGFLESLEIWDELSAFLSKKFRVIAIDLPGHGGSENIGYAHSMELMAQAVKAVMDELRLKKYILIGHSMGGYTSLAFAELFADNIKGLVLFHSTALPDSEEKKKDRDKVISAVKKNQLEFIPKLIAKLFASDNISKMTKQIKKVKAIAVKTPKRGIVAGLIGMKERKNREIILNFASYPILFIIGKKDTIISYKSILPQIELVANKEVLLLENSAHMGFYEQSEICFMTINQFANSSFKKKISFKK